MSTADPLKGETRAQMQHGAKLLATDSDTSIDGPWKNQESVGPTDCYVYFGGAARNAAKDDRALRSALRAPPPSHCAEPVVLHAELPAQHAGFAYAERLGLGVPLLPPVASHPPRAGHYHDQPPRRPGDMARVRGPFCHAHPQLAAGLPEPLRHSPIPGRPLAIPVFCDIVTACGGMIYRQGLFEFHQCFTLMFFVNPWVKYWVNGNMWCGKLGERFITQIGQSMGDLPINAIEKHFKRCISDARVSPDLREEIDEMFFCPHYPYPPSGTDRSFVVGMQHASKLTTLVHTTHFKGADGKDNSVLAMSKSSERDVYRVMLWRNNPFHNTPGGLRRTSPTGDPDQFIPHFQRFIRGSATSWEKADAIFANDPKQGFETRNESTAVTIEPSIPDIPKQTLTRKQ
eukprot:CAMPEP_0181371210 /NCGR_PEP_ID=MMETSP1106-20121128/13928_1 /TAXON_ID=81844 /ORGANISM="Mantoniella antarctica, Strain SL-175" /LENGTH=400 /DNA_ID=CAMNT_0023488235 /DNA_START=128 /DNA_END=1330 /DNA_ORIENTATION=-